MLYLVRAVEAKCHPPLWLKGPLVRVRANLQSFHEKPATPSISRPDFFSETMSLLRLGVYKDSVVEGYTGIEF